MPSVQQKLQAQVIVVAPHQSGVPEGTTFQVRPLQLQGVPKNPHSVPFEASAPISILLNHLFSSTRFVDVCALFSKNVCFQLSFAAKTAREATRI